MFGFGRNARIARLCRKGGCHLVDRQPDRYLVRVAEAPATVDIIVRANDSFVSFDSVFPIRFSLDSAPSGLFARLLLRNVSAHFGTWHLDIRDSCEAVPCLFYQLPTRGLTPALFGGICRCMTDESLGFHQELRDKFRYRAGGMVPPPSPARPMRPAGPDIVYLDASMPGLNMPRIIRPGG